MTHRRLETLALVLLLALAALAASCEPADDDSPDANMDFSDGDSSGDGDLTGDAAQLSVHGLSGCVRKRIEDRQSDIHALGRRRMLGNMPTAAPSGRASTRISQS